MTDTNRQPPLSAEAVCARGGFPAESATHPSAPPLFQTAAFDVDGPEQLADIFAGRTRAHIYTRVSNPNIEAFAADVAALEGAEAAVVAASGMGILSAALLAFVRAGDHVLALGQHYGVTVQLLEYMRSAFGVKTTFAAAEPAAARAAVRANTRLALLETVSNPLVEVYDLPAIAAALSGTVADAPTGKVPILADATFAPPPLMRSLSLGADMVWHSVTKYLNGHGDVTAGVLAGPRERVARVKAAVTLFGLNAHPFEMWLASRGMRTLPLRMRRVSDTALSLATWLAGRPEVARVFYPGLASHATHTVARRLLPEGFGGMLSLELPGGAAAVSRFIEALRGRVPFSPTLGDVRTTLTYPAMTSHKPLSAERRAEWGITDGLVRISVGLEHPADLTAELAVGLAASRG